MQFIANPGGYTFLGMIAIFDGPVVTPVDKGKTEVTP